MNEQNPDLNNSTNNGLNSETLGSTTLGMAQNSINLGKTDINPTPIPNPAVNSVPNVTPIPNATPDIASQVESLETEPMPSEPVARPIPGTENINIGNSSSLSSPNNINGFTNSNKVENIGMVPPQNDKPVKKKTMNKILFTVLIIVLIGAVAYGVYYFLNVSSKMVKLTPKTINIGIGETIPDNIKAYATVTKGNINDCSLNTRNVDTSKTGEYEVTITCGKSTYNAKVIVSDKTAPVATLNIVFRTVNTTVTVEDFVKSCVDPSNCKTNFADESKINEYMKTPGGPYEVKVEATDDIGNKKDYNAPLYVTSEDIFIFANFFSPEESLTEYKAKKVINDIFAINRGLTFLNAARRNYKYTFENESDYEKVIKDKENTITFDGITGIATYNDASLSFEISTDLSLNTLNNENNGSFSSNYADILKIYRDTKGYTVSVATSYPQTGNEE